MVGERERDYAAVMSEREAVHRELELLTARCDKLQRAFDACAADPSQVAQLAADRDAHATALFHLRHQYSEVLKQVCDDRLVAFAVTNILSSVTRLRSELLLSIRT